MSGGLLLRRVLLGAAVMPLITLSACSPRAPAGETAVSPRASDAAATVSNSIPGPRGDPSVPRADEVLPSTETRASGAPPQTTGAGTQPMTRTQEQQQMPLPTQANDHSAVGKDQK